MRIHLEGQNSTRRVWLNGNELLPDESQKVYNHSPDGFAWGYGGSGPSQLALAILLELYGDETKFPMHYHDFKTTHIATLPFNEDFEVEFDV